MDPSAVAEAAGARWVQTGGNVGYGRAANRGSGRRVVRAASLLVCNPDLVVGRRRRRSHGARSGRRPHGGSGGAPDCKP